MFTTYFVSIDESGDMFYAILPLIKEFREYYNAVWHWFTKNVAFRLELCEMSDAEKPKVSWYVMQRFPGLDVLMNFRDCMIMDHPKRIDLLDVYLTDKYDLVL